MTSSRLLFVTDISSAGCQFVEIRFVADSRTKPVDGNGQETVTVEGPRTMARPMPTNTQVFCSTDTPVERFGHRHVQLAVPVEVTHGKGDGRRSRTIINSGLKRAIALAQQHCNTGVGSCKQWFRQLHVSQILRTPGNCNTVKRPVTINNTTTTDGTDMRSALEWKKAK